MNIIEAYLKLKGQYIILMSGFSGSDKTKYADFFAKLFGFEHVRLESFEFDKDVYDVDDNYVMMKNGTKILDWDNIYKSIDWEKLSNHINQNKNKVGIILSGFGFIAKKINFEPDIHIHIKISKEKLIMKRQKYLEDHPEDPYNEVFNKNKNIMESLSLFLNTVTYPRYLEIIKDSKIDKFINMNNMDFESAKQEIFSYIISYTNKWLKENQLLQKPVKNPIKKQHEANEEINIKNWNIFDTTSKKNNNNIPKPSDKIIEERHKHPVYAEYFKTKRKRYDFNEEGIDYPIPYEEEYGDSLDDSDDDDLDNESKFIGTFIEDNL